MSTPISEQDKRLITEAKAFLLSSYKFGQHHVACLLQGSKTVYKSLHLDSHGFDICAEPIALSNALYNEDRSLKTIVAVGMISSGEAEVIPPCGNCRQILTEYCPEIQVIIFDNHTDSYLKQSAQSLLPLPYTLPS